MVTTDTLRVLNLEKIHEPIAVKSIEEDSGSEIDVSAIVGPSRHRACAVPVEHDVSMVDAVDESHNMDGGVKEDEWGIVRGVLGKHIESEWQTAVATTRFATIRCTARSERKFRFFI